MIKCVLNSALVLLIYKPIVRIFRSSGIAQSKDENTHNTNLSVIITAIVLIVLCVFAVRIINRYLHFSVVHISAL